LKAAVAAAFGAAAPSYDSLVGLFSHYGRRLAHLAELRPGEHVLDVACGRGASAFPAAQAVLPGGTVLAVDLAEPMVHGVIADASQHEVSNLTAKVMDAESLEVDDDSFDAVLCGFGIQFLPDPAKGASEFRRVVRPGGRAVVSMPLVMNQAWIGPLLREFMGRTELPVMMPVRQGEFPGESLLRQAGFADVRTVEEAAAFTLTSAEEWWDWQWTHGQRLILDRLSPADVDEFHDRCMEHLPEGPVELPTTARFWIASG
jgi:O-methyltransferase/aklanonic acid methyltransferase